jgi:hypothetical protein
MTPNEKSGLIRCGFAENNRFIFRLKAPQQSDLGIIANEQLKMGQ